MKQTLNEVFESLRTTIEKAYESGVTLQEAERLAAQTLLIRLQLADQIKSMDLSARLKKHGVKAVRAQVYMEELAKHDKKPAENYMDNAVNLSDLVKAEEREYAEADVSKDQMMTYMDIFKDAHLYFRGIMKGTFE